MPPVTRAVKADITALGIDAIVNAASVAVQTVKDALQERHGVKEAVFCRCSGRDLAVYEELLRHGT